MRYLHSVIALSLAASAAQADVTVYDNEADFLAAAPTVATQTFTDLPDMQVRGALEVDNLRFGTRGIWQVPGGCSVDRGLGANNIERRHITFLAAGGAQGAVTAVGLRVTTFAIAPPADYAMAVVTLDGEVLLQRVDGVTNGSPAYRGFVSTSPIERIIVNAYGLTQFNFCFDDVSHSEILAAP